MRSSLFACIVSALAGAAVLAGAAAADARGMTYHPLEVGTQWQYHSNAFGDHTMRITGELVVLGEVVRVRLQQESIQTYENYWSQDEDGNFYLHGARNHDGIFQAAYWPPIQILAAPLHSGKTWVTKGIQAYLLDGTPHPWAPFDYAVLVHDEGMVSVPAGDFYAYGVGREFDEPILLGAGGALYDPCGRRVSAGRSGRSDATTWYAAGVGEVVFGDIDDEQYRNQLVSWSPPVSNDTMTWGQVRSLFR